MASWHIQFSQSPACARIGTCMTRRSRRSATIDATNRASLRLTPAAVGLVRTSAGSAQMVEDRCQDMRCISGGDQHASRWVGTLLTRASNALRRREGHGSESRCATARPASLGPTTLEDPRLGARLIRRRPVWVARATTWVGTSNWTRVDRCDGACIQKDYCPPESNLRCQPNNGSCFKCPDPSHTAPNNQRPQAVPGGPYGSVVGQGLQCSGVHRTILMGSSPTTSGPSTMAAHRRLTALV